MEDILDVYALPYDPRRPVICMDEKPYQLLGHARAPLPMRPGKDQRIDSEYIRKGTCSIFAMIEPRGGWHRVTVRERRTACDWAQEIKAMVDSRPEAEKIILVMDNLNTHRPSSLYKAFPPEEAERILAKLEIHYTPVHGSWLDIAEIELNMLTRECLNRRRFDNIVTLSKELSVWAAKKNEEKKKVNWTFTKKDARTRLASLYPDFE